MVVQVVDQVKRVDKSGAEKLAEYLKARSEMQLRELLARTHKKDADGRVKLSLSSGLTVKDPPATHCAPSLPQDG